MMESWLVSGILGVHLLFVLYLLGGLVAIPAGMAMRVMWVANPWFRWTHFAASIFLVLRVWMGAACPLTALENAMRGGERGGTWVDVVLFRRMEHSQFFAGVMAQGVMCGLYLLVCPPRRRRGEDQI